MHLVGLSILSGAHMELARQTLSLLAERGAKVPVVVGGIIPETDAAELRAAGVAAVYTPKDYEIARVLSELVEIVERTAA